MTGQWIAWAGAIVAVWFAAAVVVGVLVGRVARQRDRQIPRDEPRGQ